MPNNFSPARLVCLVVSFILFAPAMAGAHAILLDSSPVLGGAIDPGHASIVLRFNSRIDAERSRLLLIRSDNGPASGQVVLPIQPNTPPDRLATQADLAPGTYVIRWQVLAVDGHITRGNVPFTVRTP